MTKNKRSNSTQTVPATPNGPGAKRSRPSLAGWLSNSLLLLGSLVIGLIVVEGAARLLRPSPPPPEKLVNRFQVEPVPNSGMVYRLLPNSRFVTFGVDYPTNELGFRDDPIAPRKEGDLRILCVGDSVTFGTGVRNEEAFPNQLEKILMDSVAEGRRAEVINGGVSAYNAENVLGLVSTHLEDLRPDLVVYTFVENDLDDSLSPGPDGYLMYYDPSKPPDAPFIQREFPAIWWGSKQASSPPKGALLQILSGIFPEVPDDALPLLVGDHPEPVRRWNDFSKTISAMRDLSESAGAGFVVYSFAARNHSEPAIRKVETICKELGILHASTLPIFDKKTYMKEHSLGYDAHCNPEGAHLMAERLSAFLDENGFLPEEIFPSLPAFPKYEDRVDDSVADRIEARSHQSPKRINLTTGKGIRGMLGGVDPVGRMARSCLFRLGAPGEALEVEVKGLVISPGREQQLNLTIEGATQSTVHTIGTDWSVVSFPIPENLQSQTLEFELRVEGPVWVPTPEERRQGMHPYTAALRRLERR